MPKVFLMTNVVGSTGLWEAHEPVMPAVLARHDDIVHGAVTALGGRVFKHTGDGMIAAFDDAEPARAAARTAVAGLAGESWPISEGIRVRASLHSGPATERNGDFFGPALNRVARINGVAHPDQIVASDLVYQLLPDAAGVDLGEHQLRDLGERVRLWQLDEGGASAAAVDARRVEQPAGAADRVHRASRSRSSSSIGCWPTIGW